MAGRFTVAALLADFLGSLSAELVAKLADRHIDDVVELLERRFVVVGHRVTSIDAVIRFVAGVASALVTAHAVLRLINARTHGVPSGLRIGGDLVLNGVGDRGAVALLQSTLSPLRNC